MPKAYSDKERHKELEDLAWKRFDAKLPSLNDTVRIWCSRAHQAGYKSGVRAEKKGGKK